MDEANIRLQSMPEVRGIYLSILRLDLIDPVVSGNKWFKLKLNLQEALRQGYSSVLTFGGAHSNHLVATATAAKEAGLISIGIVRGFHGAQADTPTLVSCREAGMQLLFISREEYALKHDAAYLNGLKTRFNHPFIIPEGGANEWGRLGTEEIAGFIPADTTHVAVSVGTGTTFIGLRNALPPTISLLGFAPMKGGCYLEAEIKPFVKAEQDENWQIIDNFHFGGFGKTNSELLSFIQSFYATHQIPLDTVYTGKMMAGLQQFIADGYFPAGSRIVGIHTGGLQGNPAGLLPDSF